MFLDPGRRAHAFGMLMNVILNSQLQGVLVTPNDVDTGGTSVEPWMEELIGVVRLEGVERGVE